VKRYDDCIICNTGVAVIGGSGGSPVAGKAIFDSVLSAGSLSVFLRNFALNIANTPDNTFLLGRNQFTNAYML